MLRAAAILRGGGLVAFPTETVYGLGANALDQAAVASIFIAKQRPAWDPLIVHVADRRMLDSICIVSPQAERLMTSFWPGPLTLLLPRTPAIPDAVTAGRTLVGVRMPAHPLALELLHLTGLPVAAPSANRFGHISPTTAAHVLQDLDGRIDAVLDGGPTQVGLESTVFDPAARIVYRPGAITISQLSGLLGSDVTLFSAPFNDQAPPVSLPSPGVGLRHYAPRARLVLVEGTEYTLVDVLRSEASKRRGCGVMLPEGWPISPPTLTFAWGPWNNPELLARNLFAGLRTLDGAGVEVILCPLPPPDGIGAALRDRLQKASRPA